MPKAVSDTELLAAISAAEQTALGTVDGNIASDRADAIKRYLGDPYGDEQPGRSSVVSRDVSDVVEGVLANVLKPFVGGDEVVQFNPHGPEDVEQAQQETDYINYIALDRNNGFLCLTAAIKDALLLRNGYVKAAWTTRKDVISETYQGMSDEEVALLMQDKDVEVVQHSEYPDPSAQLEGAGLDMYHQAPQGDPATQGSPVAQAGGMPAPMLHDIKVRRVKPTEYCEIYPVPPDELMVSERVRGPSLQDADFVQHRTHVTLSELRQMGYDVDDDIGDDENGTNTEEFARERFGAATNKFDDPTSDASRRLVLFKESYLRVDCDGDGVAELRKVCQVGENLLANDECDIIPIACGVAIQMQHQHIGLSVYDLVADLARIKTALLRQFIDNKNLANNARHVVDVTRVNMDDLLTSRQGGIIRVNGGDPTTAVLPLLTPDTGPSALQGLQYLDTIREQRSGYTRNTGGLESDALTNQTATGMEMQLSQSQLRLEMMARTLAQTLLRDLFRIIHAITLKHSTKSEKVKLSNKWVEVNPREWVARTDLSISVGLGASSQQMMVQHLMMLNQMQMTVAMPMGLVNPLNVYNSLKKLTNSIGFKDHESYFTPPQMVPKKGPDGQPVMGADGKPEMEPAPPPQKPEPAVQVAQTNAQATMQKAQMDQQSKQQELQAKAQLDGQKISREAELKQAEMQQSLLLQQSNDQRQNALDQQKFAHEAQQAERDHQFKLIQMQEEYKFKYWEAQQKLEQQAQAAQLAQQTAIEVAKHRPKGKSGSAD